ncbi:hypothetical protein TNCT_403471 [Trichonephila clavata]|uniref:Uncharacterized protein n=1 Tax=Trichonephila clavata TaxID=2740835 RepID=A0A8X6JCY4_TRICU|nr:hypothetical protein TNCT_403471 [Trichonephila clavata]
MQCLNPWTQWNFSNSACLYSTIQCLQPVHGQQDTFSEQKMHPSTTKQWFKTVHEYFKDFDEQHSFHTTRRSETSRRHPYSFRNEQRKVLFYPLSATVISFSSSPACL